MQAKNNYALVLKDTMKAIGSVGLNEDVDKIVPALLVAYIKENKKMEHIA